MKDVQRADMIQSIIQNMGTLSRFGMPCSTLGAHTKEVPTRAQLGILFVLMHHTTQSIKELALQLGISSSATTQLVNGLVTEGLLARAEDSTDRRSVRITLTAKGSKKLEQVKSARAKLMTRMFEPLSDRELVQFLKLQQKMSHLFQQTCLDK